MNAPTYTKTGSKATSTTKLKKEVFEITPKNDEVLKQAYVSYLANGRANLAVTKTRGLVRGGGKKPWRQKGTGRARFGSTRNPIWRGGGIVFGPSGIENYTKKINLSTKRLAIRQALSVNTGQIKIIESFDAKEGKVSTTVKLLNKLEADRNVLLVVEENTEFVKRATNNIPFLMVSQAKYLNVYDLLNSNHIIITKKALDEIHQWLGGADNE